MRLSTGLIPSLLLCLAALCVACGGAGDEREELRIGLLAPLSMERFNAHRVLAERVREINAAGGLDLGGRKVPVRLQVEDSGANLEQTLAAMGRLVRQQRVAALIGPYYSRQAIPVGEAMEGFRVPMLCPTASNPAVTRGRSYCFRICQVDSDQGQMMARHAYETLGLRRVAVLYDETDSYATGMAESFRQAFGTLPGASVHLERYAHGAPDEGPGALLPRFERIRAFHAQALLLPNANGDLSGQLQLARSAGFKGLFLGGDSWDMDPAFQALPEAQGSFYSTDFAPAAAEAKALEAAQNLARRAGGLLGEDTALSLDALEFLLAAARRAGSTEPEALRAAMAGLKGFEGLSGPLAFTSGGDPDRRGYLMQIDGGEARLVARVGTRCREADR